MFMQDHWICDLKFAEAVHERKKPKVTSVGIRGLENEIQNNILLSVIRTSWLKFDDIEMKKLL